MSRTKLRKILLVVICAVGVLATSAFAQTTAHISLSQTATNTPFLLMLAVGLFTATVALRLSRTGWM